MVIFSQIEDPWEQTFSHRQVLLHVNSSDFVLQVCKESQALDNYRCVTYKRSYMGI